MSCRAAVQDAGPRRPLGRKSTKSRGSAYVVTDINTRGAEHGDVVGDHPCDTSPDPTENLERQ